MWSNTFFLFVFLAYLLPIEKITGQPALSQITSNATATAALAYPIVIFPAIISSASFTITLPASAALPIGSVLTSG
jgi:hypothetical protein